MNNSCDQIARSWLIGSKTRKEAMREGELPYYNEEDPADVLDWQ